jgi:hypothetical protein
MIRAFRILGFPRHGSKGSSGGTAAKCESDGSDWPLARGRADRLEIVAVPLDGTGPTFTGPLRSSDSESIRTLKHETVVLDTDTDRIHVILCGSDGSKVSADEHHYFTFHTTGDVTIEFEMSYSTGRRSL